MTCAHCAAPMIGRKRMYCDKACSNAAYAARPKPDCTAEGCTNPRNAAKGLCKTHYNRTLPNRHRKAKVACNCCGQACVKEQRTSRYANVYCSLLCRDYARWGGQTCRLPADHWSRWYGKASAWVAPILRNAGECAWCGERNDRRTSAAYCSPACKAKVHRMRRRAREHDAPGEYTWSQVVRLWIDADKRCAYCDQVTQLADIEPDHVVSLARGGDFGITNVLACCKSCNSDKRELSLHEWARDRERRGLPPVTTRWHSTDPRYMHLTLTLLKAA